MKEVSSIQLFSDLTQFSFNEKEYDLHNDFICKRITLLESSLELLFMSNNSPSILIKFENVILSKFSFFNSEKFNNLTIDSLYRGRFEENKQLLELTQDGKGYFYLEFYEGQIFQFWSKYISICLM